MFKHAAKDQNSRRTQPQLLLGATAGLVAAAMLTACSDLPNTLADDNIDAIGKANPAASPAQAKPEGIVVPFATVKDMATTKNSFAVLTAGALHLGGAQDFAQGKSTNVQVPVTCQDVTPGIDSFLVACENEVLTIDAEKKAISATVPAPPEFKVSSATQIRSGELFMASREKNHIAVFVDGKQTDDFPVAAATDQIEAVLNESTNAGGKAEDQVDNVVRIYREDSTIQSLDWKKSREGGRLRVGLGVGQISDGRHGVVVASDTNGKRIAIYTAEDVVRLHQFGNVAGSPWATAWDAKRDLAWVTTPDTNKAYAFSIESGVPVTAGDIDVLADAQFIGVSDEGTVMVASAGDSGLQIIDTPRLS